MHFTWFFDVVLRPGKGPRGGTDPQRGYPGGLVALRIRGFCVPAVFAELWTARRSRRSRCSTTFFKQTRALSFFHCFFKFWIYSCFFKNQQKMSCKQKKEKETQQTKNTKKTQQNKENTATFFSFQSMRFATSRGDPRGSSQNGTSHARENTRKKSRQQRATTC